MGWDCKYRNGTYCRKRNRDCRPGEPGCVLAGKYVFPFDEAANSEPGDEEKPGDKKKDTKSGL